MLAKILANHVIHASKVLKSIKNIKILVCLLKEELLVNAKSYRYLESFLLIISFLSGLYLVINSPADIDMYCLVPYGFLLLSAICLIFEKYKANQKIRVRMTIIAIGLFLTSLLFGAEGDPVDNSYSYGPLVALAAGFFALIEFWTIIGASFYSSIKEKRKLEKNEKENPQGIESTPAYKLNGKRIPKGYFSYRDFQISSMLIILDIAVGIVLCIFLIDVNFIAAIAACVGEILVCSIIIGISIGKKQTRPFLDYEKTLDIDSLMDSCNEILKLNIHKDTANLINMMLCNYYLDVDEEKSNEYYEKLSEPKNADQLYLYDRICLERLKVNKKAYLKNFDAIICRREYKGLIAYTKKLNRTREDYLTTLSGKSNMPLDKRFPTNTKNKLNNANNLAMLIQTYYSRKEYEEAKKMIAKFKQKYPELKRTNSYFEKLEFNK